LCWGYILLWICVSFVNSLRVFCRGRELSLSLSLWRSNHSYWRGPPGRQNWVQWGIAFKSLVCKILYETE
jgi:hypothetical protein